MTEQERAWFDATKEQIAAALVAAGWESHKGTWSEDWRRGPLLIKIEQGFRFRHSHWDELKVLLQCHALDQYSRMKTAHWIIRQRKEPDVSALIQKVVTKGEERYAEAQRLLKFIKERERNAKRAARELAETIQREIPDARQTYDSGWQHITIGTADLEASINGDGMLRLALPKLDGLTVEQVRAILAIVNESASTAAAATEDKQ